MVGINKFTEKDRRRARRSFQSNHIAKDLYTPKYRPRVVERKRVDNEDGTYWFTEDDDEEDSSLRG